VGWGRRSRASFRLPCSPHSRARLITVKGALNLGVAYLLQFLPILCGFRIICLSVDGSVLNSAVDTIGNIVT